MSAEPVYVEEGLRFVDKRDLIAYLERWLEESDSPTIGRVGNYGGKRWVTIDSRVGVINLNSDTRREAVEALVDDARSRTDDVAWTVIENSRSRRTNKVLFTRGTAPTPGWYAYLPTPFDGPGPVHVTQRVGGLMRQGDVVDIEAAEPRAGWPLPQNPGRTSSTVATGSTAAIVHFPHPGGEHVPPSDDMPWNRGNHRRKFLTSLGTYVDGDGQLVRDEIVFWGEWEAQSRVVERWNTRRGLPTVLHSPYWSPPVFKGERQNTDPWVFGDAFRYSNCKQIMASSGSSTGLQTLRPGTLILFGSTPGRTFVLDTAFVVSEVVGTYQPTATCEHIEADDAFDLCVTQSLATLAPHLASATFTLYRGATVDDPVDGMFSFVPCRRRSDADMRFRRPTVVLPDVINPRSTQSPSGAKHPRPISEIVATWHALVRQVQAADLRLGTQIDTPPKGMTR